MLVLYIMNICIYIVNFCYICNVIVFLVNLIKGYRPVESAGLPTEGRKTVTSMAGQPLEELTKQMVSTDLHMARYPDDQSDDSMVDEFITPVSFMHRD